MFRNDSIVIAYQNVRSLLKNISFIKQDQFYNKCGVLISYETHTRIFDIVELDVFRVLFRIDSDCKKTSSRWHWFNKKRGGCQCNQKTSN